MKTNYPKELIIDNLCYFFFFCSIIIIKMIWHWALSCAMSAWSLKLWSHHVSLTFPFWIANFGLSVISYLTWEFFSCYRPSIWIRRQFAITFNGNWKLWSTQNAEREKRERNKDRNDNFVVNGIWLNECLVFFWKAWNEMKQKKQKSITSNTNHNRLRNRIKDTHTQKKNLSQNGKLFYFIDLVARVLTLEAFIIMIPQQLATVLFAKIM